MIQRSFFIVLAVLSCLCDLRAEEPGHQVSGTLYGNHNVHAYASSRHGPDGALFLDPYFIPYLQDLKNKTVLDAGCGTGPWSIYAAKNGATVYGIDLQEKMIELAKEAVKTASLDGQVNLVVGDVTELPYPANFFDLVLSINVGCNLPSTRCIHQRTVGLGPHVKEIARVLKEDGIAILTAPASLGKVFTNGSEGSLAHIFDVLKKLSKKPTSNEIILSLNELKEVNRATFVIKDDSLLLVTNENELEPGEEIWRKLPGLTVPNHYHSESEYFQEFIDAGLLIEQCFRSRFLTKNELTNYNGSSSTQFGSEYAEHHPFVVFFLAKNDRS